MLTQAGATAAAAAAKAPLPSHPPQPKGAWEVRLEAVAAVEVLRDGSFQVTADTGATFRATPTDPSRVAVFSQRLQNVLAISSKKTRTTSLAASTLGA
jgi:hypothetical protein